MWLLSELSIFLLEHLFILRAGKKKGTRTPELCRFSVLTFGVSKSFPKSNRQFHVLMPSLVFRVKLEEMESKGKEKMNSVPWNCSFWMLLYFCSKAHWTWVGNIKTTYPASEICAVQQRQSWMISQTSRWNHKQSLRNTLHQNVPFGARLGKTNEHDRQRNAEKSSLKPYATHQGKWHTWQRWLRIQTEFQPCQSTAPEVSSISTTKHTHPCLSQKDSGRSERCFEKWTSWSQNRETLQWAILHFCSHPADSRLQE